MPQTQDSANAQTLASAIRRLNEYRGYADRAIAQVSDEHLRQPLPGDHNSIAIIMKHMAGNMLSRWTDFLTSDGEKPWRRRDTEFIDEFTTRADVEDFWQRGWSCCIDTLESLSPHDLMRTVTIRGESHTVVDAIHRQLVHYGYHIGQIVLIARILVGEDNWKVLTVPRGGSEAFNRQMGFDPGS